MGRAAFLVLALAVGACARTPPVVFGERMPRGCTKESKSERCVGWMFDRLLMTIAFKRYDDPAIQAYVETIGARLARANDDRRRWTYRILDDNEPQAYAGFDATIYITRGALAVTRDEAELAAIIGHEMGHTIAGHHREAIADLDRDVGQSDVQRWRDLRYARDDEIQADEQAVIFLARAGYDVHAVERMLRALGGYMNDDDADHAEDRHPVWRERIARVAALAARHPAGARFAGRYNASVAKLVVGEDPREIAIVGTTLLFARTGVAVDLPAGTRAYVFARMVMFLLPDGAVGTAQLIDRHLVADVKNDHAHTELIVTASGALAITIVMPDGSSDPAVAKAVVAKQRKPRTDELANLHPMTFDPTRPRPIWAP